jgi:hypothetical protein
VPLGAFACTAPRGRTNHGRTSGKCSNVRMLVISGSLQKGSIFRHQLTLALDGALDAACRRSPNWPNSLGSPSGRPVATRIARTSGANGALATGPIWDPAAVEAWGPQHALPSGPPHETRDVGPNSRIRVRSGNKSYDLLPNFDRTSAPPLQQEIPLHRALVERSATTASQ